MQNDRKFHVAEEDEDEYDDEDDYYDDIMDHADGSRAVAMDESDDMTPSEREELQRLKKLAQFLLDSGPRCVDIIRRSTLHHPEAVRIRQWAETYVAEMKYGVVPPPPSPSMLLTTGEPPDTWTFPRNTDLSVGQLVKIEGVAHALHKVLRLGASVPPARTSIRELNATILARLFQEGPQHKKHLVVLQHVDGPERFSPICIWSKSEGLIVRLTTIQLSRYCHMKAPSAARWKSLKLNGNRGTADGGPDDVHEEAFFRKFGIDFISGKSTDTIPSRVATADMTVQPHNPTPPTSAIVATLPLHSPPPPAPPPVIMQQAEPSVTIPVPSVGHNKKRKRPLPHNPAPPTPATAPPAITQQVVPSATEPVPSGGQPKKRKRKQARLTAEPSASQSSSSSRPSTMADLSPSSQFLFGAATTPEEENGADF
jgi:hypothetical protein